MSLFLSDRKFLLFTLRLSFLFLRFHNSLYLRFWQFCIFFILRLKFDLLQTFLISIIIFDNSLRNIVYYLFKPIFVHALHTIQTWKSFFRSERSRVANPPSFSVGSSIFKKVWIRIQRNLGLEWCSRKNTVCKIVFEYYVIYNQECPNLSLSNCTTLTPI